MDKYIIRGGSWIDDQIRAETYIRCTSLPSLWYYSQGFRVVREDEPTRSVIRGGSWSSIAGNCHSAFRGHGGPVAHDDTLGFRIVKDARNE